MSSCCVAGSFDPFTSGHRYLVERGVRLFDMVHVLVADNPAKQYVFTARERYEIVVASLRDIIETGPWRWNIKVWLPQGELTADFMKRQGCNVLLRGVRHGDDLLYESEVEAFNDGQGVQTVYVTARQMASSTAVRNRLQESGSPPQVWCATVQAEQLITDLYRKKTNGPDRNQPA